MWRAGIDRFSAGVKARLHLRNRNRDLRQAAASSLETDKLRLPPAFRSCRVISCGVAGYDGGRGGQAGSQRRSEIGPMTLIKAFSGGDNVVIINRWRRRAPRFLISMHAVSRYLNYYRAIDHRYSSSSPCCQIFVRFFHQKNRRSCIARVNPDRGFLIFVLRSRFRFSKWRKFEWFARNFVTEMKIRNRTCEEKPRFTKKSFKIRHVVNRSRRYQMLSFYSILKRSTCLFLWHFNNFASESLYLRFLI